MRKRHFTEAMLLQSAQRWSSQGSEGSSGLTRHFYIMFDALQRQLQRLAIAGTKCRHRSAHGCQATSAVGQALNTTGYRIHGAKDTRKAAEPWEG